MKQHYEHNTIENEMQKLWEDLNLYEYKPSENMPLYSIDTPPPTVSGTLHIGHIFSYTQAEMIARYKRMRGFNVFYPFGFDDNGLPTERLVEKELSISAKDLSRSEFNNLCLSTTKKYEMDFKELWQSLGFSVDWSLQYETIGELSQRISQRSFIELYKKGKAYLKESPVLWCTECQTSIAQAELESKEKDSIFYHILFKSEKGEKLEIATTRPELLYGTVCLFVHPDDNRYKNLIGTNAIVPIYEYKIPIYADEKVAMEKGSGIVMCSTFGDQTDLEWFERYNLPYRKVIMPDGAINKELPDIGGLHINKARRELIKQLEAKALIIKSEPLIHTTAVHERCGKPIEIIPSKQWYIDILSEKDRFIKVADEINWYPAHMKMRYLSWVENLKWDWCISRQRYFGVPFPVWYCDSCGKINVAEDSQLPVNPLETNISGICECGGTSFSPETAVLDTWATSSVTPQINARWGEADAKSEIIPMSMRTQAHEIIRTWAFYSIVKSIYHTGNIPWKDIMICGFVLAKKGEKISKSKNNAPLSPNELIKNHSADAVRYWAATARLGTDTFFSEDDLKPSKRFINKLWNASKFTFTQLEDFSIKNDMKLLPTDKWIIERCKEAMQTSQKLLDQYEIGLARHEVDILFFRDFCDYYLEIAKDRLYKPEKHGELERRGAQYALYLSLFMILKLYAIFVPHIAEYLYQSFYIKHEAAKSIHQLKWCEILSIKDKYLIFGDDLKAVISDARRYKSENSLSMKSEMPQIEIICSDELADLFELSVKDIASCCHAEKIFINGKQKS